MSGAKTAGDRPGAAAAAADRGRARHRLRRVDPVHTRRGGPEQPEAVELAAHAARPLPVPRAQGVGRQQPHRLGHQPGTDLDGRAHVAARRAQEPGAASAASGRGRPAPAGAPLARERAQGQTRRPAGAEQTVPPVPRRGRSGHGVQ